MVQDVLNRGKSTIKNTIFYSFTHPKKAEVQLNLSKMIVLFCGYQYLHNSDQLLNEI